MNLVIIVGPPAVGKMSVGQELSKITDFKLFHNHMTIELVLNFFNFGEESFNKLVSYFREKIFEEVSKSELKGLIFTYVCDFDSGDDKNYLRKVEDIFKESNIYYVELEADLSERLKRNKGESRLVEKPSKRDIKKSEEMLLQHVKNHKLNSDKDEDFFKEKKYIRIDNTNVLQDEVAKIIKNKFIL